MAKLIIKIATVILVSLFLCNVVSYGLIRYCNYSVMRFFGQKSYRSYEGIKAIEKANNPGNAEVVIVGDSVAKYITSNDKTLNLATNLWVSMAGQYIIVDNLIKHNKNVKKIYLFVVPESLENDLAGVGTYNYFIKPFYTTDNMAKFSSDTISKVNVKPYSILFTTPISKILPIFSIIDYSRSEQIVSKHFISPTTADYLRRIKTLCTSNNIQFAVLPCPISKTNFNRYMQNRINERISSDLIHYQLLDIMANYFSSITVLDDKYFLPDLFHSKDDNSRRYFLGAMAKYL